MKIFNSFTELDKLIVSSLLKHTIFPLNEGETYIVRCSKDENFGIDYFNVSLYKNNDGKNIGFVFNENDAIKIAEMFDESIKLPSNFKKNDDGTYDVDGNVTITEDMVKDGKLIIKFGKVGGYFDCGHNQLISLEGAPREVGGSFWCNYNKLTSLEGAPKEVGGNFGCGHNQLISLEGAPREVGGNFGCGHNQLISLEGAPREVGGSFWCSGNARKFTEEEVRKVCTVKGEIYN